MGPTRVLMQDPCRFGLPETLAGAHMETVLLGPEGQKKFSLVTASQVRVALVQPCICCHLLRNSFLFLLL